MLDCIAIKILYVSVIHAPFIVHGCLTKAQYLVWEEEEVEAKKRATSKCDLKGCIINLIILPNLLSNTMWFG